MSFQNRRTFLTGVFEYLSCVNCCFNVPWTKLWATKQGKTPKGGEKP